MKLPSPAYWAAMLWIPCGNVEMVILATPPPRLIGEPKGEPSARNWTTPEGMPALGARGDEVAVKVRFDPVDDGLDEEVAVLAEEAGVTDNSPGTNTKL